MNLFLESDSPPTQNPKACLVPLRASKGGTQKKPEAGQGAVSAEASQQNLVLVSQDKGM